MKKEKIKEIEINKEEEKKGKKKWLLLLLLLLLSLLLFISIGITYSVNETFKDKVDEMIIETLRVDTPTSPKIVGDSDSWTTKELVRVEKDAKSYSGIAYYEYCVSSDKDFSKCKWIKTETKNMIASTTGKYYVVFRGVSNDGTKGKKSNIEEVLIDNEAPTVSKLDIEEKENKIKVTIEAKDKHSGIAGYYYKIDDGEYKKVDSSFEIKGLENKEYTLTIKIEDKLGNVIEVSKTVNLGKEENSCKLNCDLDDDGKADLNIDKNNDGICDLNCDTNGDLKPDKNIDTNNDGICDKECSESVSPETTPGATEKPTPTPDTEEEDLVVPEINLDKVPVEFLHGEIYDLPSYYKFGPSGGVVECTIDKEKATTTEGLKVGTHNIECIAKGNNGINVRVSKTIEVKVAIGLDEEWDGWIRLNLYYPENSTDWEWRIGRVGEIRDGYENTGWQAYTGPILVKIDDVDDVYIRYTLNGETVIQAPYGKVAVDIEPEKYTLMKEEDKVVRLSTNSLTKTKVEIHYDKDAITKEYRIGSGEWQEYTGSFEVGANTLIEARAVKEEKVYDSEGNYVYTSKITGEDSVFISELIKEEVEGGTSSGGGNSTTPGGEGSTVIGTITGGSSGSLNYTTTVRSDGSVTTILMMGSKPSTYLAGPIITSNPSSEIVESVKVKVTPQEEAEKIYISIGGSSYREYKEEVTVTGNTTIRAYYIRKSDGKVSNVSYYDINNIKVGNKPYVRIDTNPSNYLSENVKSVEVSISGSNYDKLEYSFDGKIYNNYTGAITVKESSTIYARGINSYGVTVEKKVISTITPSVGKESLSISIFANPESSKKLINKTTVTIDYDSKATKKYYKLAGEVDYKEYTGPFEIDKNTTVYAYATGENASGYEEKGIDFLTTGIMAPIISVTPTDVSSMVTVSITYDKNATNKYYQINGGEKLYYTGPFEIYENSEIYAYNSNTLGYEADSSREIDNIKALPKYLVIEKGKYYIIRLNYPEASKTREYKWKVDGTWKIYDPKGILLIKPEYKDEYDFNSVDGIKVEDENGKEVIFTDHYYLIDVAFNKLMENLFMRWDVAKPKAPQIIVTPSDEPTDKVEIGIMYSSSLTKKYYKVVTPSGKDSGWKEYSEPFIVEENNSIVYAKGETFSEVESVVSSVQITNIDKEVPVLEVNGDFTTPKQKVTVSVKATDNIKMSGIKWASGERSKEYFKKNGESVKNPGTFIVNENGKYTIYAKDYVGNDVVKVIEVTNIDKNAPDIMINVLTEEYGTEVEVSIDYGDSTIKEYKIGETTTEYKKYTEKLSISSYDVYQLANSDGSITLYAKGTDEAGNIQEVSEKIYLLDLDMPEVPVIYPSEGYPMFTKDGMVEETESYIVYDKTREDLTNYYRVDDGEWKLYTGPIIIETGTIEAKSVKESGLEVTSKATVKLPTDAVDSKTYDEDLSTSVKIGRNTKRKFTVSSNIMNKTLKFYIQGTVAANATINLYDKEGQVVNTVKVSSPITILNMKADGYKVEVVAGSSDLYLREITLRDEKSIVDRSLNPVITIDNADWTVEKVVNIKYPEGYKNEYSIDNGSTWKEYTSPFTVEENLVVEARIVKNTDVVAASTFKITKVDAEKPIVELNGVSNVQLGYDTGLPTYSKIGISGGSVECSVNGTTITNTKELKVGSHEVTCTAKSKAGKKATVTKTIRVVDVSEYSGNSILEVIAREDIITGKYDIQANGEVYPVHVYVYDENQHWTNNREATFGNESDIGTSTTDATRMVIVKVNGNVTIDSGVTVGPYYTQYGGPKGFTLYVTGKLTNNGTIDNSHGGKAVGQDVYLWKNTDGTYEYVPATGGAGASSTWACGSHVGGWSNAAPNASGRETAGGGSGYPYSPGGFSGSCTYSGAGGTGSSYSGGTGGGGVHNGHTSAGTGSSIGGAGGYGNGTSGGVGNPGSGGTPSGTGGLLVIYANQYVNDGTISANGTATTTWGGASGGGSINIFTNQSTGIDQLGIITDTRYDEIKGETVTKGGAGSAGGAGGSGTINIGTIRNNQYYDLKEAIEQDKAAYIESVTVRGDSILSILNDNNLKSGYYFFVANGESYPVHLYTYDTDQHWTTADKTTFGDDNDVGTANDNAQNMVIVKVNGNLTIDEGVTVGPYYTEYGGPKGFTLYVTGKLTNNGTIDNSHGGKAEGQNVYLWKNVDGTYEYVPAVGGAGASSAVACHSGNAAGGRSAPNASGRETAGGGSGYAYSPGGFSGSCTYSGAGGTGSSYSGGTGGGGVRNGHTSAGNGSSIGGAGGTGNGTAGGVGNPGLGGTPSGTGGLLVIYANQYANNGTISANGTATTTWGGASGGGSINVLCNELISEGETSVIGGKASGGGAGGAGTVTYTKLNNIGISSKSFYSNYDGDKLDNEYSLVTINFFNTTGDNYYSIDDGATWNKYSKPVKVSPGVTVKAKTTSVMGTEVESSYTTSKLTDNISNDAFDNNKSTKVTITTGNSNSFTVSDSLVGRKLKFYVDTTPASDATIKVFDSNDKELDSVSVIEPVTLLNIPDGSYKITISSGSSELIITDIKLRNNNNLDLVETPLISLDSNWTTYKEVVIDYIEGYKNEYSIDSGETWIEYTDKITINSNTTVIARSVDDNGKVVSSSSYTVTKIDTTNPGITVEIPDEIIVGDEYSLPTSYTVDDTKSGGSAICKIGEDEITNTSGLEIGTYEIVCTVTTGAGNSSSVIKNITVKDIPVDITLELDDKILLGTDKALPTTVEGGTATCKVGEEVVTNIKDLEVGTHTITCTVTSTHGTTKEVSKDVEIYEEVTDTPTEEENTETGESEGENNETITE